MVGNPPYITVKDKALGQLYRDRYDACHRQYSLAVPFAERFFNLAVPGDADKPAGYVGMITANSFMKREFGKKLVEEFFPTVDLTHVIDTSGAYIPGHGTPTVILFGRDRRALNDTVRAVMGIRGEPSTPAVPAQGLVWSSIVTLVDLPGQESEWVSSVAITRDLLQRHPWSLGGGRSSEIKQTVEGTSLTTLGCALQTVGFVCMTRADDVYFAPKAALRRAGVGPPQIIGNVEGGKVRDWSIAEPNTTLFPYDNELAPVGAEHAPTVHQFLWPFRTVLWLRREPNGNHLELGLT